MIELRVPGDKSIAHRVLILSGLANGTSRLEGLPHSTDVASTVGSLRRLGVPIAGDPPAPVVVQGPTRWIDPGGQLDCGNSGTTARLLTGLISGLGRGAELTGDASLRARPMDRVVYPLQAMGARIRYLADQDRLPIRILPRASGNLRSLRYRPRVSSAQVKSALLLAAVCSRVEVEINHVHGSRDHTERLLSEMGAPVGYCSDEDGQRAHFAPDDWDGLLRPLELTVPGDVSSASFLVAAALLGGREVRVSGVGLNPTRTGFLDVLHEMGCPVRALPTGHVAGEPVGDLVVRPASPRPFRFGGAMIPRLIDEIPMLAVLAATADGQSEFRGAGELRHKESDRLALLATNLRSIGVDCDELEDGLRIRGGEVPPAGLVRTAGDHRMAMAFGVLARLPGAALEIDDPECVNVSYPSFWRDLDRVLSPQSA